METIKTAYCESPAGPMIIGSFAGKLCMCDWISGKNREADDRRVRKFLHADFEEGTSEILERVAVQLDEYFSGRRRDFDIPVLFTGSAFQNAVWAELMNIPYGTTISYAELARRIGNPRAVRAVANANANNPIPIFVPCHRVIGSDGSLTGYAGGLDKKRYLLTLESSSQNELFPHASRLL